MRTEKNTASKGLDVTVVLIVLMSLGLAPAAASAEDAVCTLAKNVAKTAYQGSMEKTRYDNFRARAGQYWHETELISQRLRALREAIRGRPSFSAAEPEFRRAFFNGKYVDSTPLRPERRHEVIRQLDEGALMEVGKIKLGKLRDLYECDGEDVSSEKSRGKMKYEDQDVKNLRPHTLLSRDAWSAQERHESFSACEDEDDKFRYARMDMTGGVDSDAIVRVEAYNGAFGTGHPVKVEMNVGELLFEPLPTAMELAETIAASEMDMNRPPSESQFVDKETRAVCGADGTGAQAADGDSVKRPYYGDGSKTIEGVTGRSGR